MRIEQWSVTLYRFIGNAREGQARKLVVFCRSDQNAISLAEAFASTRINLSRFDLTRSIGTHEATGDHWPIDTPRIYFSETIRNEVEPTNAGMQFWSRIGPDGSTSTGKKVQ